MNFLPSVDIKTYTDQDVTWKQVKADGHHYEIYREAGGTQVWSKNHKLDIADKLSFQFSNIPVGVALRCELHCPGLPATSVPTLINERSPRLVCTPFVVHRFGDLGMAEAHRFLRSWGFTPPATEQLEDGFDTDQLILEAEAAGIEGYVLKESHLEGWYKLKPTRTVDAVVVEAPMSQSTTYFGGLKCLVVAVWDAGELVPIANVGTGFEGEYKKSLDTQAKRNALIGLVCEVEYQDVAARGRLKFPRFIRWRDDKEARQCLMEQL